MDITVNSLGWQPPPGERIVSLCHMRDEIIMATDNGLYVIRYDIIANDYPVEKIITDCHHEWETDHGKLYFCEKCVKCGETRE